MKLDDIGDMKYMENAADQTTELVKELIKSKKEIMKYKSIISTIGGSCNLGEVRFDGEEENRLVEDALSGDEYVSKKVMRDVVSNIIERMLEYEVEIRRITKFDDTLDVFDTSRIFDKMR